MDEKGAFNSEYLHKTERLQIYKRALFSVTIPN